MNKKILTLLLLSLSAFTLIACGNEETKPKDEVVYSDLVDEYEIDLMENKTIKVYCEFVDRTETTNEFSPRMFPEVMPDETVKFYIYDFNYTMEDGTVLKDAEPYSDESNPKISSDWVLEDKKGNKYCFFMLEGGLDSENNVTMLVLTLDDYKAYQEYALERDMEKWLNSTPARLKEELESGLLTQEQYDFEMAEYEKIKEREKNKK